MRKRTNEEIQAYIEGYNDSYDQFCECMKGRKSLLDAVKKMKLYVDAVNKVVEDQKRMRGWIPFKVRPLTEEEKEMFPDFCFMLDGKIPEDGQRILVTIKRKGHEEVQLDEFYTDGCGLDSGYDIGTDAIAWMPLPGPYCERQYSESAKEYCADCDHIEMCGWYPYEGCEFRSLPKGKDDEVHSDI